MGQPFAVRRAVVLMTAFAALSTHAAAQSAHVDASSLATYTKMRLTLRSGERRHGHLTSLHRDTVEVVWADGGAARVPVAEVARLDIVTGRRRPVMKYAVAGLFIGAGTGAMVGAWSFGHPDIVFESAGEMAGYFGLVGGGAGTLVGGLLGVRSRERWTRVPLGAGVVRLGARSPFGGGEMLGIAVRTSF